MSCGWEGPKLNSSVIRRPEPKQMLSAKYKYVLCNHSSKKHSQRLVSDESSVVTNRSPQAVIGARKRKGLSKTFGSTSLKM